MEWKDKKKKRIYNKKYYQKHKKKIKRQTRKYYSEHKKERVKYSRKYKKEHRSAKKHREYFREYRKTHRRTGITPKSKCVNGCKVPWYILQKHHLKNGTTVIMCPNCHEKYHWKEGRYRING